MQSWTGWSGWKGRPCQRDAHKFRLILASYDCVSLDMVASELIGIDPLKVPTNKAALSRGSGPKAELAGVPLEKQV